MPSFLRDFLFPIIMSVVIGTFCYGIGRSEGNATGFAEGLKKGEGYHQCHSTDTRPCAFGPGIVGVQECSWGDQWLPCEPDPSCCRSKP